MGKNYFRSLAASLFLLLGMSTAASAADFTGQTVQAPTTKYEPTQVVFSLKEVAAKANLTAEQLVEKLDAWAATFVSAEGDDQFTTPNPMVYLEDHTVTPHTLCNAKYTQGSAGGFWMNRNGLPVEWGESAYFYNQLWWSTAANDSLVFELGQYPNRMLAGGELTAHYIMSIDGGLYEISFDLTLVVESDFEAVETCYPKLTIVGEENIDVELYAADGELPWTVDFDAIAAALGCPVDYLANNLSGSAYVAQLDNSEESLMPTARGDTLTNLTSAQGLGWWFNLCTDLDGNPTNEGVRVGYAYGTSKYYIEKITATKDEEGKYTLGGNIGQYGASSQVGDYFYSYIYLIFGSKAYALKFNLNIISQGEGPEPEPTEPMVLAEMQKVGSEAVTFEEYKGATDTKAVNLAAIAQLMGEEWTADTLIFAALADETGETITLKTTANNGGYWMTTKGVVVKWSGDGSSGNALYIEPAFDEDDVVLTSGNASVNVTEEQSYTFPMFFITPDSTKYYQLDVTVSIKVFEEINTDELTEVAVWPVEFDVLAGGDYSIGRYPAVDLAALEEAIGTREPTFLGWAIPDEEGNTHPEETYSMHCDPAPGWWFNADGYVSGWGTGVSMVGVSLLKDGVFDLYRMPGVPKNGDVWNAKLIMLNDATKQYVTIDLTLNFFDTLITVETAGEEDIDILANEDTEIDVSKMLETLGITPDFLSDNPTAMGYLTNGKWSNMAYTSDGIVFKDGKVAEGVNMDDNPDQADFLIGFYPPDDAESGTSVFFADVSPGFDFSGTYKADLAVAANNKAYVYHITVFDEDSWVGVKGIQANVQKRTNAIYNLAGQRVSKATKGVYIVGGNKVAVK